MRFYIAFIILILSLTPVLAETIMLYDFETDPGPFISFDPAAKISLTTDPEAVLNGSSALKLEYNLLQTDGNEPSFAGAFVYQITEPISDMKSFSFNIKPSAALPFVVMIMEGRNTEGVEGVEGPRYMSINWCPANQWSKVQLSLDDFTLDPNSPEDPSGKLEAEQIGVIAILDMSGFMMAGSQEMPIAFEQTTGERTLFYDDFALLDEAPTPLENIEGEVLITDYSLPLHNIVLIGGLNLSVERKAFDEESSFLSMSYELPAQTLMVMSHMVKPGSLCNASSLRLSLHTEPQMAIMVGVEENLRDPATGEETKTSYNTIKQISASKDWQEVVISFADLQLEDEGVDMDGMLTPGLISTVTIGDMTAMMLGQSVSRNIELGELSAVE